MRLNKYIASTGYCSRRQADKLISNGKVSVNGEVVSVMATQIGPEKDKVTVDGKELKTESNIVTYILNKPKGVVTTADDPHGRKTVLDFVPKEPRVFPCGRLDVNTMGLVLLTNDGNLCYQLTHPKFEHEKEYFVEGISKDPKASWGRLNTDKIRVGIHRVTIDSKKLKNIKDKKINFWITIHEGKYHIVRKLCGAVGIEILHLTRLKLGHYELGDIDPGHYREINE